MNKQNSQNGQQQLLVPCPLCEDTKKKGWAVCAKCHDIFVKEATSLVLKEQDAPSKEDWLIQRLQLALPGLEKTLQKTEEELEGAKRIKDIYLNKFIADKIAGQISPS